MHHLPAESIRSAEKAVRLRNPPFKKEIADASGGDGTAIHAEEFVSDHRHATGLTPDAQIIHVSAAETAEGEIHAHMDERRRTIAEDLLEERLRSLCGEFTGERQHRHIFNA